MTKQPTKIWQTDKGLTCQLTQIPILAKNCLFPVDQFIMRKKLIINMNFLILSMWWKKILKQTVIRTLHRDCYQTVFCCVNFQHKNSYIQFKVDKKELALNTEFSRLLLRREMGTHPCIVPGFSPLLLQGFEISSNNPISGSGFLLLSPDVEKL